MNNDLLKKILKGCIDEYKSFVEVLQTNDLNFKSHVEKEQNKYLENLKTLTDSLNDEKIISSKMTDFILCFAKRFDLNKTPDYVEFFEMLDKLFGKFELIQSINHL